MKIINIKIVDNSKLIKYFFPRWVSATTIGRTIRVKGKWDDLSEEQKNHEKIHVAQYEKYGKFKFLWIYFIREMFVKYKSKRFEVEAYENQWNMDYVPQKYGFIIEENN